MEALATAFTIVLLAAILANTVVKLVQLRMVERHASQALDAAFPRRVRRHA